MIKIKRIKKLLKNKLFYIFPIIGCLLILFFIRYIYKKITNTKFANSFDYLEKLLNNTTNILKKNNIDYWLDFGTCLGAYRDNDFIPHDTDIDISICIKDLKKLKQIIEDKNLMIKNNLKVVRNDDDLFSLKLLKYKGNDTDKHVRRNGEDDPYIDIYIFDYKPKLDKIEFKGDIHALPINTDKYLEYLYGKTWNKPIKGKHAEFHDVKKNIKTSEYFKNNVESCDI